VLNADEEDVRAALGWAIHRVAETMGVSRPMPKPDEAATVTP